MIFITENPETFCKLFQLVNGYKTGKLFATPKTLPNFAV